ncbi:MAG: histidinol-phosphate transaminase [Okeania sp. SIO2C2]|uniref:histidinol-phosphate transaminase n=1 Tax=Okeania sp. SIO2C2 TaxID=2607787 RepID=UPI0013B8146A|nr:histidinol-phosphate transaminase [Okeania sp. SIO2C2]NEP91167.1 histidinol-phosphate transaminase [Okeania sp. SIO2C2]
MLPFIRSDLSNLKAYTPHPGGSSEIPLDRLDTNECPYDLPDNLKQKLAGNYRELIETNRYPDGSHFQLKEAIAEYVNEATPSANISADNISVGNGSDELIRSILIATCLGGEGSILTATPTFSMYSILAKTLGISIVNVGRNEANFEIDISAAQDAINQTNNSTVKVVFVVNPNSPTANALTAKELEWLLSLPEEIMVVIDEAYFEFSQTTVVEQLNKHPNWVILRTFSKAFKLASLRVGYAIAHPEVIINLEKVRLPYNLPSFSQAAAKLVLVHRQDVLSFIPEILTERTKLFDSFREISALQVWESTANFFYARLTDKGLSLLGENLSQEEGLNNLMQQLKNHGTLIRHTGGGLRITVGTPEENQRTIERIKDIFNKK